MSNKPGVIYTIEFDGNGKLVRFDSRLVHHPTTPIRFQKLRQVNKAILAFSGIFALIALAFRLLHKQQYELYPMILSGLFLLTFWTILIFTVDKNGQWMSKEEFLKDWIIDRQSKRGYKYHDRPGCYVITTYHEEVQNVQQLMHYEHVYVGQSLQVFQRLYNHFSGRGNGKIYGDIQSGMFAYVRIIPCRKSRLNELEKQLIAQYKANASYNLTSGGATNWQ